MLGVNECRGAAGKYLGALRLFIQFAVVANLVLATMALHDRLGRDLLAFAAKPASA